jgi:hypothetical protein
VTYTDSGGDEGVIKMSNENGDTNLPSGTVTAIFFPGLITTAGPAAIRGVTREMSALYTLIGSLDVELGEACTPGSVAGTFADGQFTVQFKPIYFFDNLLYDPTATSGISSYKYCHEIASGLCKHPGHTYIKNAPLTIELVNTVSDPILINSWNISLVCTNEGIPTSVTTRRFDDGEVMIIPSVYHPAGSTYTEEVFGLIDYKLADNSFLPLWMVTESLSLNTLGAFNSKRSVYGSEAADFVTTYGGDDVIEGKGGDDVLGSGSGKDNVNGGDGNDVINSGEGSDTVFGGAGNDDITAGEGNDKITTGEGNDVVLGGTGNDTVIAGAGNDNILAGDGNDMVDAGTGDDLIVGGDGLGNDTYNGGVGIDTVKYSSALASITVDLAKGTAKSTVNDSAGIGIDKLSNIENVIAGNHDDVITGSKVSNTVTGGAGNDTFVFNTKLGATNIDTITDFTVGDKIALAGSIFSKLKGDKDLSDNFKSSATDNNDYLIYESSTGKLYYDADGSGGVSAVQVALIGTSTHPSLAYTDIAII